MDAEGKVFLYQTTIVYWLRDASLQFCAAILTLLHELLYSSKSLADHADAVRGAHLACILGHHRQHLKVRHCLFTSQL